MEAIVHGTLYLPQTSLVPRSFAAVVHDYQISYYKGNQINK